MSSSKAQQAKKARARKARTISTDTTIVADVPLEEMEKLPKLSETILEFAKPITSHMADPPTREEMESAMILAQIAWNLPLFEQRKVDSELAAQWEALAPGLPRIVRGIVETMMEHRCTVYRHDPRIATVELRDRGNSDVAVYAETRLVSGLLSKE